MNSFLLSKLCVSIVYSQPRVLRIPLSLKESLEGTDLFDLHAFGLLRAVFLHKSKLVSDLGQNCVPRNFYWWIVIRVVESCCCWNFMFTINNRKIAFLWALKSSSIWKFFLSAKDSSISQNCLFFFFLLKWALEFLERIPFVEPQCLESVSRSSTSVPLGVDWRRLGRLKSHPKSHHFQLRCPCCR